MSLELSITAGLTFKKGLVSVQSGYVPLLLDVQGVDFGKITQVIPTSNTAITVPASVASVGYVLVRNLDSANFVQVGLTGSYTIKLLPLEFALFRAAGTLYALADTASVTIETTIIEA